MEKIDLLVESFRWTVDVGWTTDMILLKMSIRPSGPLLGTSCGYVTLY